MSFLLNPFVFSSGGVFEPIASSTVGSGGTSIVSFTLIPSNYTHLQLRLVAATNRSPVPGDYLDLRFNDDSTFSYGIHVMGSDIGNGSVFGYPENSSNIISLYTTVSYSPYFSPIILDIFDYSNTSKNTTIKSIGGQNTNSQTANSSISSGIYVASGVWLDTDTVDKVTLTPKVGTTILEHSTFALYGIRAD